MSSIIREYRAQCFRVEVDGEDQYVPHRMLLEAGLMTRELLDARDGTVESLRKLVTDIAEVQHQWELERRAARDGSNKEA